MDLEQNIKKSIKKAFSVVFSADIPEEDIKLQPPGKGFEGTHTFTVFNFSKVTRQSPESTASALGDYLQKHAPEIAAYNVANKGFLNLTVSDRALMTAFNEMAADEQFGELEASEKAVVVEYSSPNTNKPLHLGHLRNNFLGWSVAEILKEAGYTVKKVNLVNDRGIHICKSMLAYVKLGAGETPESSGLKGDKLVGKYYVLFDQEYKKEVESLTAAGIAEEAVEKQSVWMHEAAEMLRRWEQGDPETVALWEKMNGWVYDGFERTYRDIEVDFDKFYYESNTYLLGKDIVREGLERGIFYRKNDGSVWIDLTDEGLDHKLLLRSDGTSVYITQDLGTAELRYEDYGADTFVYVIGNEQDYHIKVLKAILKKLGRPYAEGIHHLSYGMVDLPSGKMKSREGTVVDADDLLQEMFETAEKHTKELGKTDDFTAEQAQKLYRVLGLGALKYFILKVDPKKRMLFNPEESIDFQGHTGPFIQYTHARISAILRKAEQLGVLNTLAENKYRVHVQDRMEPSERELILTLCEYPEKLWAAAEEYSPAFIAQYVYDLAKAYNRFYAEVPIFGEPDKDVFRLRISLSRMTARLIRKSCRLLGIEVPERM